jgi:toxin-antitoxin system PIN domain toxin
MLLDANLLLYATDSNSPNYERAAAWLTETLNGNRRVGLPWQTIGAFLRISTHPRIATTPLAPTEAWSYVESWLAADPVWVPPATERTAQVLADLVQEVGATGNLVTDAQLAALALEHGLTVLSADTDFARFPGLRWANPLRASR